MRLDGELLEAVLSNAGLLIVVLDRLGRIRFFNKAAERLSGRSFAEVEGKVPWETVLPPESASRVRREAFEMALEASTNEPSTYVNEWVTTAGERRLLEWTNTLLRDAEGEPEFMVAVGTDITQRAQTQNALAESQRTLRALVDSLPLFVCLLDSEGHIEDVNEAALATSALGPDELLGQRLWDLPFIEHSADVRRFVRDASRQALAGELVRGDVIGPVASGEVLHIDTIWAPVRDDDGRVEKVVVSGIDVSDRRESERVLQEKERRLVEAQRLATLGSWDLDLHASKLSWSDEIFRIFEIEPTGFDASYDAFLAMVHPDDRELVDDAYTRSVEEHSVYRIEHRLLFPDGRTKWVEERGTTEYDETGAPVRSTGTVQDITERKARRAELERAVAEQETLLRELHHRVRNNLLIISGFLYFEKSRTTDAVAQRVLGDLERRLEAMSLAHEKLFQSEGVARIELGEYLSTLTRHIVDSTDLSAKRVELDLAFDTVEVDMDRALPLGMMLSELLTNAGKHAFPSDRGGHLRVHLKARERTLTLTVKDDGAGLPEEATTAASSFGWRLIRRFEEQLGAEVAVRTEQGTEVVVRLPVSAKV